MDRRARHRILQKVLWSRFGLSAVRAYLGFSRRWDYVVMNRSLLGEVNGEHWLLTLLPPEPFIVDVGFNRGDFSREALRRRPQGRMAVAVDNRQAGGRANHRFACQYLKK